MLHPLLASTVCGTILEEADAEAALSGHGCCQSGIGARWNFFFPQMLL